MQTKKSIAFVLLSIAVGTACAQEFSDTARVLSASPRVERTNTPRRECRTEYQRVERNVSSGSSERGVGGQLIGGVVGGLLGSQVGGGNGKVAAAAAGAIAGTIVGDRMQNDSGNSAGSATQVTEEPREVCRTVDSYQERTVGYNVSYEYHGRTYSTTLSRDPGSRMPVRVRVSPVDER